jgi:hypothetical protein
MTHREINLVIFSVNVLLCLYGAITRKEKVGWMSGVAGWLVASISQYAIITQE